MTAVAARSTAAALARVQQVWLRREKMFATANVLSRASLLPRNMPFELFSHSLQVFCRAASCRPLPSPSSFPSITKKPACRHSSRVAALDALGETNELIFVDDGSHDRSVALLCEQFQRRPGVTRDDGGLLRLLKVNLPGTPFADTPLAARLR